MIWIINHPEQPNEFSRMRVKICKSKCLKTSVFKKHAVRTLCRMFMYKCVYNLNRSFSDINCFIIWLIRLITTNISGELQKICPIYSLSNWHKYWNCLTLTKQTVRSVKRLAAGWRFRCLIPGGGIIGQTDPGGPTSLPLLLLPDLSPMNKATGAWCWPTVPFSGEVKISRLSTLPLCLLRLVMGWNVPLHVRSL